MKILTPVRLFVVLLLLTRTGFTQTTEIKGFVDVNTIVRNNKLSFNLGEQDLFITSQLNDRFSFLGESVFRFSAGSPTTFDVSIERVVLKYNFKGNHNLLLGKHHTPINYWNDTYHHGRVFFPTIGRPLLFTANLIPLHTIGLSVQGHNLGGVKFGYDLLVGNGLGSTDILDNDASKSVTAALHIKPMDEMRIGASYYNDVISKGSRTHDGHILTHKVNQQLFTGSIAWFGKPVEFLSEATIAMNKTDSTGQQNSVGMYAYAGYKINEKWVPYVRFDYLNFPSREIFYHRDNSKSFIAGLRYNINYLAVVKLEYQYEDRQLTGSTNSFSAQVAIGF